MNVVQGCLQARLVDRAFVLLIISISEVNVHAGDPMPGGK